jgi:RNA polymerase sigma-70 factor (ECF subfamily)
MAPLSESPAPGNFGTTRWSLVGRAGASSLESAQALAALCELYWYPLYAYVRRHGRTPHDAQDLTQGFFAQLLEKRSLAVADQQRGRFRSFLLTSMKHYLANQRDAERAQKRGGGDVVQSLDLEDAEGRYAREPADTTTPESLFERRWALTILEQTLARLRDEMAARGKTQQFEVLKGQLGGESAAPYAELAANLGIAPGAIKVAVHRLRKRYRELLREQISQTLADPTDVDDEIRDLFAALAEK